MVEGTPGSDHHKEGSTKMSESITKCAGIDVSKLTLDIAVHGCAERFAAGNDGVGHRQIAKRLAALGVSRVGMEASGHYEAKLARHLRARGFDVLVLDPGRVHGFKRFRNERAKTDAIDAELIAAVTAAYEGMTAAPDERLEPLAEHMTLIEQIGEDVAKLKTRRERFEAKRHKRFLESEIARLDKRRKAEIARLTADLCKHDDLAARYDLLFTVPTIGPLLALSLVIRMPELGRITRGQAAALVGVAPFNADSGQYKGQRHIQGGRARVRRMVWLAAFAGSQRWNPILVAFYKRLIAAGKHHKVAVTACARKLVEIANAVLARGTPWREANA
jgi:transposase